MWATFLITLREGLEAALIVGIVLGLLQHLGQPRGRRIVWAGVAAAIAVSIIAGLALNALGVALQGFGEQLFEGLTMLLAAGVLTWMIFWMERQGRQTQTNLENQVRQAVAAGGSVGALFVLSFVAVLREGIETALFLTASTFGAAALETWLGALLGLAVAVGLGALLFLGGRRLNVRLFFRITGVLLVLFAAGLFTRGIHEFQEAGLLPVLVEHVWDLSGVLPATGVLGSFLQILLGYSASPSLVEVIGYTLYLVVVGVLVGWSWRVQRRPTAAPTPPQCSADTSSPQRGAACQP